MAGLPNPVVARVGQIKGQLEANGTVVPAGAVVPEAEPEQAIQPTHYPEEHPAGYSRVSLLVDCITQLDAMNNLYALAKPAIQKKAGPTGS